MLFAGLDVLLPAVLDSAKKEIFEGSPNKEKKSDFTQASMLGFFLPFNPMQCNCTALGLTKDLHCTLYFSAAIKLKKLSPDFPWVDFHLHQSLKSEASTSSPVLKAYLS